MFSITDFLKALASYVGVIYSMLLFLSGVLTGILLWRWFKSLPVPSKGSFEREVAWLEHESELLGRAVSKLWQKAGLATINRNKAQHQSGRVSAAHSSHSKLGRFYPRILRRWLRTRRRNSTLPSRDLRERFADANTLLNREVDRIRLVTNRLPEITKSSVPIDESSTNQDSLNQDEGVDRTDEALNPEVSASPTPPISHSNGRNQGVPRGLESRLLQIYNNAVGDSSAREQFREYYQPVRIGTVNAVERRQNPTTVIQPEFREATDGDLFAIHISQSNSYAVLPRLGLTIGAVSYNAGALGEMFGNPPYEHARSYSRYRVRRPAIFKREDDRWILEKPGDIDLGPSD